MPAPTEELHYANEELRCLNEELQTLNEELTTKVEELTSLNDDLDNLIAAIDVGTIFLDLNGRVRRFTPSAAQSVVLDESDLGRRIFDLPLRLDYSSFDDDIRSVLAGGPAIEHKAGCDGGTTMVRIRPYHAGRTSLAGAVLTFVDVTRLTAAERRLQVYINSLPHQVAVIDSDSRILLTNAAWVRFAAENGGRPDKTGVGSRYLDVCARESSGQSVAQGLQSVLQGEKEHFSFEYPCHSPSEFRWFLMNAAPVEGGVGGAVVSHINITERKQVEEELRLAASVFENSGEGVVITDARERIVSVNRAFTETTGFTLEDVIGLTPQVFTSARQESDFSRSSWKELTAGGTWRGEVLNRRRDGHPFSAWLTISQSLDSDGRVRNYVALFSDISARKEAERRLMAINAELEQFAYVASHDLREPLRMVGSYLGMIERRLGDSADPELLEFLGHARDGARRMDQLILDLLEYSRIGRQPRPLQTVRIGAVVDKVLTNLKVAIEESGTEIFVTGAGLTVRIDEDDCLRVLQNLIANAIKYCPPTRRPGLAITCRRDSDMVHVSVIDNGIGIDPAQHGRIFRMFQRLHGREEFGGGTGIGLAICKKSVERMGGTIQVTSISGAGSTFTFTMPAASAA